jgi:hypothetical protein
MWNNLRRPGDCLLPNTRLAAKLKPDNQDVRRAGRSPARRHRMKAMRGRILARPFLLARTTGCPPPSAGRPAKR